MSLTRKWKNESHRSKIYSSWIAMMRRCYRTDNKNFDRYGGRGIFVSNEWHNYDTFFSDMISSHFEGATLDRIDNNKGYSLENCRWANRLDQAKNRSTSHKILDPSDGVIYTLTDLAKKYGLSRNTITSRIRLGYNDFKTLTKKTRGRGRGNFILEESRQVID